jgi:hypothetical protein
MAIHIIGVVKINALAKKVLSLIAEYSMIPKVGRAILTAYEASTHQRAAKGCSFPNTSEDLHVNVTH